MGATDPKNAAENTIRKLYGLSFVKNSVHGSDSLDNAKNEINFSLIVKITINFYYRLRKSFVLKLLVLDLRLFSSSLRVILNFF